MEFFHKAKAVRIRSIHDKYLTADEDEETVTQDRNGSSKNARWTVEPVSGSYHVIRLKSCYGTYLTASNERFLLGATGRKVVQSKPSRVDSSSVEWEPVSEGSKVKIKTGKGHYLRANGGVPPWRNSVTHDRPHTTTTQDWILWDVDVIEIVVESMQTRPSPPEKQQPSAPPRPISPSEPSSPSSVSAQSGRLSRQESSESFVDSPPKQEGRTIYYHIADEIGDVNDDATVGYPFTFKGNSVERLTEELKQDTGLEDIIVCTRSPLNGKLFPLRLQLPPNNADMHVVLVPSTSRRE